MYESKIINSKYLKCSLNLKSYILVGLCIVIGIIGGNMMRIGLSSFGSNPILNIDLHAPADKTLQRSTPTIFFPSSLWGENDVKVAPMNTEIPKKLLLYGILTVDSKFARRMLIRSILLYEKPWDYDIDVYFVLGRLSKDYVSLVQFENDTFHDIIVLDIKESMNDGKTFAYFEYVANHHLYRQLYAFVGKFDDDTYTHFVNLHKQHAFNTMYYFGKKSGNQKNMTIIRGTAPSWYMYGMGYGVSMYAVYWLGSDLSYAYHNRVIRAEDATFAVWLFSDRMIHTPNILEFNWSLVNVDWYYCNNVLLWEKRCNVYKPLNHNFIYIHWLKNLTSWVNTTKFYYPNFNENFESHLLVVNQADAVMQSNAMAQKRVLILREFMHLLHDNS
ncbi:hypothetical protein RFI_11488 [Reticulomyxa filosa]|uniref:Hexosyltransferase n=1 Tax=Reticulomyxa filosa TaxID=46433 RepID=X6NJW3_RETFI|nr:hypothetical protein RFI_11488 [Reticulomyxa filosa]|eukprot:ETO25647.1 hypothetical protein RFI_11488 [Reticulomyxa filosa]